MDVSHQYGGKDCQKHNGAKDNASTEPVGKHAERNSSEAPQQDGHGHSHASFAPALNAFAYLGLASSPIKSRRQQNRARMLQYLTSIEPLRIVDFRSDWPFTDSS